MPYKHAFLKGKKYLAKTAAISALCLVPVTASWAQAPAYTLQVIRSSQGHVSAVSDPGPVFSGQISCGPQFSQCHTTFHPDTNVVLTATPAKGFRFDGWGTLEGEITVSLNGCGYTIGNECHVTMRGETTIVPLFSPVTRMGGACESREFSDAEETIIDAYIAYYGRPPDAEGLIAWAGQLERPELHRDSVLTMFGESNEFQENYGKLTARQLINNLYLQIFGRNGDEAGVNYYTILLQSGGRPLTTIAMEILEAAQNDDVVVLENRRKVARHFASISGGMRWRGDVKKLFSLVNGERVKVPRTVTDPDTGAVSPVKDINGNDIFDIVIDMDEVIHKANSTCTTFTDLMY